MAQALLKEYAVLFIDELSIVWSMEGAIGNTNDLRLPTLTLGALDLLSGIVDPKKCIHRYWPNHWFDPDHHKPEIKGD